MLNSWSLQGLSGYTTIKQEQAGPILSKFQEVRPVSVGEILTLHLLIIAAITLVITIGRHLKKQPPPNPSKKTAFSQAINLSED